SVGPRGARQLAFDIAHGVVTEEADQSAAKARQTRTQRCLEAGLASADEFQRILVLACLKQLVVAIFGTVAPADFEARVSRQSDERIAAEALTALHRFEQVGPGTVGELEVDRQRCIEVGESLQDQRNAVEPLGGELTEFRLGHDDSTERRETEKTNL